MSKDKKAIYRAGIIPFMIDNGSIKMLFMRPSDPGYGGSCMQIAKGKMEKDETPEEAALREGLEELGLFRGNIEDVTSLGPPFFGRTHLFIGRVIDKELFGDPCFETGETAWLTEDEFVQSGRELHRPAVKAAVRLIKEKHK